MKTQIKYCLYLVVFASGLFATGCGTKEKSETPESTKGDSAKNVQSFQMPITHTEHNILKSMVKTAYSITTSDNLESPSTVEPVINLDDFEKYINSGNYDGIRIYPGYIADVGLVFTLCNTDTSQNKEFNYITLKQVDYSESGKLPSASNDTTETGALLRAYLKDVKLFLKDQTDTGSVLYNKIKYSRYYPKTELNKLISQNLEGNTTSHDKFKIMLEFGYVPYEFAATFISRLGDSTIKENHMIGFTTMMHIVDPSNTDMIDTSARYEADDYKGRYLEVGNPCPPRCGVLKEIR